jgi:hypothetical protein
MATDTRITPQEEGGGLAPAPTPTGVEPSLGELFKQLAQDSTTLIQQEISLAKTEMRDNVRSFAKDVVLLAAGGAVLLVGALVLTAFLVALLGDLLNNYWLGALIVGAVYALVGFVLLKRGQKGMRHDDLKPDQALETLQADKRWAQREVQEVKRNLTS